MKLNEREEKLWLMKKLDNLYKEHEDYPYLENMLEDEIGPYLNNKYSKLYSDLNEVGNILRNNDYTLLGGHKERPNIHMVSYKTYDEKWEYLKVIMSDEVKMISVIRDELDKIKDIDSGYLIEKDLYYTQYYINKLRAKSIILIGNYARRNNKEIADVLDNISRSKTMIDSSERLVNHELINETVNKYKKYWMELIDIENKYIMNVINDINNELLELSSDESFFKNDIEESTNKEHKKIINDYKEMNELLEENGFVHTRRKGSHKIYTKDGRSIPVPQHNLGKGLSLKIEKEILKETI